MEKVFISPSKYVQDEKLLWKSAAYIEEFGRSVLLLTDEFVWNLVGEKYTAYLSAEGLKVKAVLFQGESSEKEIDRIVAELKNTSSDVLLALGGGKIIDTGKAAAGKGEVPCIVIPTTAATDAPTSSIAVVYEEDGRFKRYDFYQKSPALILVDTSIIAAAPAAMLAAGMADALSTAVEARAVWKHHGLNTLGKAPTLTALAIAEKCEEVIFSYGLQAFKDNQQQQVTSAFEAVVEANTLMSGLGFESGGLAAAHAIHNGFSAIQGKIHQRSHGEKIAYTTIIQLVLEKQASDVLKKYIDFFNELNLPLRAAEIGIDLSDEETLLEIGRQAALKGDSLNQMEGQLTAEDIVWGMKQADEVVANYFL